MIAAAFASVLVISIHAAREGGDVMPCNTVDISVGFQSTPPVKAATKIHSSMSFSHAISIHAAREGGDLRRLMMQYPY